MGIIWCLIGRILGVFDRVMCLCVRGDARVWAGDVVAINVWLVSLGVGEMLSTAVPKMVASCCNASPCCP